MLTPEQKTFLRSAASAAEKAGHIFPEMAACEAALESAYGRSVLALLDKNLFGMKQHKHPIYGTHILPTKEFQNGEWITINASWVSYPDWASCFKDRMATLERLATAFPHYAAALKAKDGQEYVREVSQTWSTDPKRAEKVIAIYDAMVGMWDATAN
jgi:flagellum-specific peptidoglycan hydrolase FlgJ